MNLLLFLTHRQAIQGDERMFTSTFGRLGQVQPECNPDSLFRRLHVQNLEKAPQFHNERI